MKFKHFLSIPLLFLCWAVMAQQKDAIKYSKAIAPQNAQKHLSVLASDNYLGRETGTKGGHMAATYIRDHFQKIGLQGPVNGNYMQAVDVRRLHLIQYLQINGKGFKDIQDFFNMPSSVSVQGYQLQADSILFAGYGVIDEGFDPYNDYEGQEIEGKVVMIIGSSPRDNTFTFAQKMAYLTFHKAKAVLMIEPIVDKKPDGLLQHLHTDQMLLQGSTPLTQLQTMVQPMPLIYIGQAVADQILSAAGTNIVKMKQQMEQTKKPHSMMLKVDFSAAANLSVQTVQTDNILGFIPGSDPVLKEEILLVTAHYDHLGVTSFWGQTDSINNGADDNGSGTTGLLLIADAFGQAVKAGKGPGRSILFMAMTGEEKGLLGSSWYVEYPVFPLKQCIADLNVDMIGRTDTIYRTDNNYVYIIGADRLSSDLDRVVKETNKVYTKLQLDERYNVRQDPLQLYYRSDHYNFAKNGIPVIFFFNGFHDDYHKPSDEISKIDFEALCKRAQLIYYTAWELANGQQRPMIDKKQ